MAEALKGMFSQHQERAAIAAGLCCGSGNFFAQSRASRLIQDYRTSSSPINRDNADASQGQIHPKSMTGSRQLTAGALRWIRQSSCASISHLRPRKQRVRCNMTILLCLQGLEWHTASQS